MKKITLALALIFSINLLFSNPVDTVTAKIIATNFWKQNGVRTQDAVPKFKVEQMLFNNIYILTAIDTLGFVIVSADDRVIPILGYSDENSFDVTNIPPNLIEWLMGYEQQIQYINEENIEPSEDAVVEWNTLREGGTIVPKSVTGVNPLINTKWDQGQYYNDLCPTNIFALNSNGHTVTGCVATAMAQVMKYWNYPTHGRGYHSYNCSYYSTQSANFANTTYKWSYMPNQLTASSTTTQVNAVATLMYHCGVSVDMDYGISSTILNLDGSGANMNLIPNALINYFRYDNYLQLVYKSPNFSDGAWSNLLKNELNNGRPIIYGGQGTGGHAFVCDGYNNSNYFHFNWGWSGNHNGYYSVNDLSPGDYNFSSNQLAIIGIQPSTNTEPELEMYSTLNVNDAWFGSDISGSMQVLNAGTNNYSGYIAVVIFNDEGIAIDNQIFTVSNLPYNYYITKNINISGGGALIPGIYYAFAAYSEDGNNWSLVPNGSNAYSVTTFHINYSAPIETNSDFSNTTLIQGQTITVNVDVLNTSSQTFYGKVRVNLSNIEDGSFVQNIQVLNITNGLQANYHYTNGLDFTGTITATPGTYLMELAYQNDGETQWYFAGSSNYSNPVFVTVIAPPTLSISPSSISFQQSGGSSVVNVTSNVNWTATSSATWLTITPNTGTESGSIIVTASTNNSNYPRSATITLTGNNGVSSQTISIVQLGSTQPDMYEPNNTASEAYLLGTIADNSTTFDANANFHITTDNDYYKINLPSGYSYSINANILNSYNNSNYTADAKFATSQDGNTWSSNYGNSMPALTISDGGTLYFRVLPYTNNEIGTYSLHIVVTRTGGGSSVEPDMYEPNNTASAAYLLGTVINNSTTLDVNANFHVTTDNDYYKINLPTGYSYTINANILNSYNNSNYTADAKFATSTDGSTWSSNYGNSMSALTMSNGGTLYFRVLPYTNNEIGTYSLHITISRQGGIDADAYEPNNSVSAAYLLETVNGSSATINAEANFHTTYDADYYKIIMLPGYSYAVDARIYDSYNDDTHTVDAKFAVSLDGNQWSEYYGVYAPTMTYANGGRVYYHVIPNQSGTTGTYRLNVEITASNEIEEYGEFTIQLYPNPASDYLYVTIPESMTVNQLDIFNMEGQLIKTVSGNVLSINISNLSKGMFFLQIHTEGEVVVRKFVKK